MAEKFGALQFYIKVMLYLSVTIGVVFFILSVCVVYMPDTFSIPREFAEDFFPLYGKPLILFVIVLALIAFFMVLMITEVIQLLLQIERDLDASLHVLAQIKTSSHATHTIMQKMETAGAPKRKKVDTKELFAIAEKSLRPQEMEEADDSRKRLLVKIKNDISDKKWQEALDSACLFLGRYPDTEEAQSLIGLVTKLKLRLGKCPQCDAEITENQTRCIKCGYEIDRQKKADII